MANEILRLAYQAACETLAQQDSTLGNLRTRATGLLAAAAVGTSFATSVGLYKAEPGASTLPTWAGWSLLVFTIVIGASVMIALWPATEWNFGANAAALLANSQRDLDVVHTEATRAMVTAAVANEKFLGRRFLAYRIGVLMLTLQAVTLVLGVLLL